MNTTAQLSPRFTRRHFLKTSAAAATLTAASWNRVWGANQRVGVGIIGYGLIGRIHAHSFKEQPDVNVVALAETYQPRLEAGAAFLGGHVAKDVDFRRMLENKDVDAVVVATPDHWHALMTMMACVAGKDVYVEKPTTLFVREGRWMMDVARRTRRVVQVGTQNRSGPQFRRARTLVQQGRLGDIVSIQNNYFRNLMPGFGNPPDQAAPPELDYDLWLGPAPQRPYNPNRVIYQFRWCWDYSGGQMTNMGQHSLDLVHWMLGVKAPKSVYSVGGRWFLKDNCEVPDTQDVILEYPGFTVGCQYREASAGRGGLGMGGLMFYGTHGCMPVSRTSFELLPDPKVDPFNTLAAMLGGHPVGGPQLTPEAPPRVWRSPSGKPGSGAKPQPVRSGPGHFWTEPEKDESGDASMDYRRHARNFLDCVKSRQEPVSDLESGHQVVTACHLSNISMRVGRKLVWDADKEEIVGDPEASAMLVRPYRKPWDAELRALGVGA